MKRFLILFALCFSGASFAQEETAWEMPYFQFRYLADGKLHTFALSGFSDVNLMNNKDVYMSFVGAQKSPDLSPLFGVSIYSHDSIQEPYYTIYEFDTIGQEQPISHLYKNDGSWMYTLRELREPTEKETEAVSRLLATYTTNEQSEAPALYTIDRGEEGNHYYMVEIRSDVLPQYESTERQEYDDFTLRIVTDHDFNVMGEYQLFGSSTELRELHLMSPLFLK